MKPFKALTDAAKKHPKRTAVIAAAVLLILFCPFKTRYFLDGGTREYCALAYKAVSWHKLGAPGSDYEIYSKFRIYWFPYSRWDIDRLWQLEEAAAM